MNPENPSRPEIEAKITALLLGELPEDEARVLRFAIAQDAGLQKLHDRLKVTIGLVREVAAKPVETAPLKLSEERRQKLMAHFKTPRQRESFWVKPIRIPRLIEVLAVVAVLAVLAALLLPALSSAKRKSMPSGLGGQLTEQSLSFHKHFAEEAKTPPPAPVMAPPPNSAPSMPEQPKPVTPPQVAIALPAATTSEESQQSAGAATGGVYSLNVSGYTKVEVPPASPIVLPSGGVPEAAPVVTEAFSPSSAPTAMLPAPAPPPVLPAMADNFAGVPPESTGEGAASGAAPVAMSAPSWTASDLHQKSDNSGATLDGLQRSLRDQGSAQSLADKFPGETQRLPGVSGAAADNQSEEAALEYAERRRVLAAATNGSASGFQWYAGQSAVGQGGTAPAVSAFGGGGGFVGSTGGGSGGGGGGGNGVAGAVNADSRSFREAASNPLNAQNRTVDFGVSASAPAAPPEAAMIDPNTGLPFSSEAKKSDANSPADLGSSIVINPATGLPMPPPETGHPAATNPMGQFPGSTTTLAFDSAKLVNGQMPATTYRFQPNDVVVETNAVLAMGDIPVTGRVYRQGGTTFAERLNTIQPGSATPTPTLDKEDLDKLHDQLVEGRGTYIEQASQLQTLQNLAATNREKLREVVPTMFPDGTLSALEEQLRDTQQKYNSAQADYSATNLIVLRLKALDETLQREVDSRVDGVMAGLESQVESKKASLDELQGQFASSKQAEIDNAAKYQPYYDEKAKLEQLEDTHKLLYSKIKAGSIDAAIPHANLVQITDAAKPQTNQSLWQKFTGQYASTARVQVQNDGGIIQGMATPAASGFTYDPYFIQNTFEIIQSQAVLSNTVARLDLNDTWGKKFNNGQPLTTDDTIRMLKGHLSLTPVKNTKLISITVTESDPQEAAAIANAVAQSYSDFRAQQTAQITAAGLTALQQSYLDESNRIQELQAEVDRLNPNASKESKKSDAPLPKAAPNIPIPQPEIQVKDNAFSTFSMNVSDVSFQLAAAALEKGHLPEAASVRSEEFVNAFDYRDPEPSGSERIAFNWERSQDPFAHNRDFLRFSLKTAATGREPGRPLNLVLLLDDSGSMERADRVAIIQEALRILATQLQPQDTLSIVTFARTAHLWADGIAGDKAGAVLDQVSGLTPEGGTNLEEAMRLAYETARRHYLANGLNRVVLITDGAANLGDVDAKDLKAKVDANRKQGIALDCFGIGWEDYNDDLLEQLSSQGDGRYAFLNTPADAHNNFATKLAGALQIAASGVKVQVEFNPQRTISYRQIGYATHQLTKQQFRDNTVAAGELAAAESGNALYTVEVNPEGDGPIATVHVRYQIPGAADYREQSWDVPYNGRSVALEKSSPAMRLAVSAAAFSEWLTASPYAAEVTPDELLNDLNGVPAVYGPDARPKKLEWMIRQAKSITAGSGPQY